MNSLIEKVIIKDGLAEILTKDGWERVEQTVRNAYPKHLAEQILERLEEVYNEI